MQMNRVSNHFEKEAFEYDGLIPKLIPHYEEQHEIMLKLIPFSRKSPMKVLDLGCGTGVLSYHILKNFENALVVLFDLAKNMLETSKKNLLNYKNRITFKQGNFAQDDFGMNYDVIVSGLSIHHLDHKGKEELYQRIFNALNPGGIFINREIVYGATPGLTDLYHSLWRKYIKGNGEDDEKWFNNYLAEDLPATVEEQLTWLNQAGFMDVGCHWRYLNFAIFGGRKG